MKKEKFHIEYILDKVSHRSLWNHLTTQAGLAAWFADKVKIEGKIHYTFYWHKTQESARAILVIPDSSIRFRWEEETDPRAYFEFAIHFTELTNSTSLEITDFAEPDEKDDAIELWDSQVETLKRTLGV